MKSSLFGYLTVLVLGPLLSLLLVPSSQAFLQEKVFVPTLKIYVPLGFDSNDEVEVVLWGRLPSSCYEFPNSSLLSPSEDSKKVNIELIANTRIRPGENCLNNQIDFLEDVKLGVMAPGTYTLAVNEGTPFQQYGILNIDTAQGPNVDNFQYANVEYIETDVINNMYYLVGTNPSDCMQLDQIKIISNKADVFAVLPIMKKVESCTDRPQKFKYPFALPDELSADMVLLHLQKLVRP